MVGIIISLAFGVGFLLFYIRSREQNKLLVGDYMPIDIRIADLESKVALTGRVVCANSLTTPLSQKPSVFYSTQVSNQRTIRTFQNREGAKNFEDSAGELGSAKTTFYLKDDTGQILIVPDNFEFFPTQTFTGPRPLSQLPLNKLSQNIGEMDKKMGKLGAFLLTTSIMTINSSSRYKEYSILVDSIVTALGTVKEVGGEKVLVADEDGGWIGVGLLDGLQKKIVGTSMGWLSMAFFAFGVAIFFYIQYLKN